MRSDNYKQQLETFNKFEENFTQYILYDKRADEDTLKLWKAFEQDIAKATDSDVMSDNKVCLMAWLYDNWKAWLDCVLDGTFKYMNVVNMVFESWIEFCN